MKKLKHIGIIMDGNRRWATAQGKPKFFGHTEGAKNTKKIIKLVKEQDIAFLTLWALSTENLKRDEKELKHLFSLFNKLVDYITDFVEGDVRVKIIGNLDLLPTETTEKLKSVVEKTKNAKSMVLTLAIAYGGRDEIVRATKKIIEKGIKGYEITEDLFSSFLDTDSIPDLDLVIRTGMQKRLSGFLPWQATYAEIYFTDVYWPAFDEYELKKSITWFEDQKRNFGK